MTLVGLPICRKALTGVEGAVDNPRAHSGEAGEMNDDELRIVVVDDFVDAAESLARVLELNGYSVRCAHDGIQALKLIEQWPPLCVILDIDMPGLDGLELSTRLRQRYGDDIVLIAVTGWDKDDPRVAGTYKIVDHYLPKPVDPAELRRALPPVRE